MPERFGENVTNNTVEAEQSETPKKGLEYYQYTVDKPDVDQRREARLLGLSEYASRKEIDDARDFNADRYARESLANTLDCPGANLSWDEIELLEAQAGRQLKQDEKARRFGLFSDATEEQIANARERRVSLREISNAESRAMWQTNAEERNKEYEARLPERAKEEGLPPTATEKEITSSFYRRLAARDNRLPETATWDEVHEAIYGKNWKEEHEKAIHNLEAKIKEIETHILEKYKLSELPSSSGMQKIPGAHRDGDIRQRREVDSLRYRMAKLKNEY